MADLVLPAFEMDCRDWIVLSPTDAGLPEDVTIAHKTGTMPGTLNDVGIITSPDGRHHIAIAVFTKGAARDQETRQEAVVAEIAGAVYAAFTKPSS